jgi:glycosyltransferase involved in cell wall biosynthesis
MNTGIGQVTINFLKELSKSKRDKFVLYLEEDLPKDIKLPRNFRKRIFLPLWRRDDLIRKTWWEKIMLPKKIKEDRCDVFLSLYQCPTKLDKRIKHIMVVHDIIPELFSEYLNNSRKKMYWNLTKKAILQADKILAISVRTEKDLIQQLKIDPKKIAVSYIDVDELYKKEVSEAESKRVLRKYKLKPGYIYSGGGLEVRKNMEGLIRAYALLFADNKKSKVIPNFPQLVISGKLMPELAPLMTDAEKLIKELNLTRNVKLLDFVPQENLPALYQNATVFVFPSLYEGFGLAVLEAMNIGTPVIASRVSSLPEVGRDAILYFDPEDIQDIAMVIKNVLQNENLKSELKRRSKERAASFDWKNFVRKLSGIIENNYPKKK